MFINTVVLALGVISNSKSIMLILITFALSFSNIVAKNEDYIGYKVYNVEFHTQTQQDNFYKLKSDGIDYLRKPSIKHDIIGKAMVPPSHFDWFEEKLAEMEVERDVVIENVYEYLNGKDRESTRNSGDENVVFDFDAFYRYDVILDHLYALQETYENSTTSLELVHYGVTEENRPLVYLKITDGIATDKPVVVVEAAINPREWITVSSALTVAQRLLEDDQRGFLDDLTWIIVPVLNPDGYEYTHTNLRFWSKSRSLNSNLGFICPGVNLNRNFDINWLISDSSSSPCSHLYAGVEAFSEIETKLIRDIIQEYSPRLYISLQNNGKFVTYPWIYEKAASGLFRPHYLLGQKVIEDLEDYKLDSGAIAFGDRYSGTSTDYARMNGVFYTFNVGVEGGGSDGVIIPEENIKTIAEDVWKAVAAAANGIESN